MKYILLALLLGLFFLPRATWGETACPWINNATASDILGDTVSLAVQSADGSTGTCAFQSSGHNAPRTLQIVVRNMEDGHETMGEESQCTANRESVKGIGNDAMLCDISTATLQQAQVTGRVRNRLFAIRVESSGKGQPTTEKMLRDKATFAAEQVSGNLF